MTLREWVQDNQPVIVLVEPEVRITAKCDSRLSLIVESSTRCDALGHSNWDSVLAATLSDDGRVLSLAENRPRNSESARSLAIVAAHLLVLKHERERAPATAALRSLWALVGELESGPLLLKSLHVQRESGAMHVEFDAAMDMKLSLSLSEVLHAKRHSLDPSAP